MKIAIISPTPADICAFGVRSLAAFLKHEGHEVKSIFLPTSYEAWEKSKTLIKGYKERIIDDLLKLVEDTDLIGVSFMTNYFDAAVQITEKIRGNLSAPVIWGGAHPTVQPDECLNYVDMVCIGEGEEAFSELAKKMEEGSSLDNIRNVWIRKSGAIIRNELRPLIQDIDSLPSYDFELENQYVIDIRKNKLVKISSEIFEEILPREVYFGARLQISFRMYTSRGCPHSCSYCINSFLRSLYPRQKYLRFMSVGKVIEEMEMIRAKFPFIETFVLFDDTFIARSSEEISLFGKMYRERIGLPFRIQVSPTTISKKKLIPLVESGLIFAEMGIQTGNEYTKNVYSRSVSNKAVIDAAKLLNSVGGRMLPPRYHVILDNPWEKTRDVMDTVNLILNLPKPFSLATSSLVLYPGTELYEMGLSDGTISNVKEDVYRKNFCRPTPSYQNLLIFLAGKNYVPRGIVKILTKERMVAAFDKASLRSLFLSLERLFQGIDIAIKGCHSLAQGDFSRVLSYMKKKWARGGGCEEIGKSRRICHPLDDI